MLMLNLSPFFVFLSGVVAIDIFCLPHYAFVFVLFLQYYSALTRKVTVFGRVKV